MLSLTNSEILALHQNPLEPNTGSSVRTINILKIMSKILGSNVILYTLAQDKEDRGFDKIIEKHIKKPFPFKNITGGYLCIFPILIKRQLRRSDLTKLSPSIIILEGPFMGYAAMKTIDIPKDSLKIYDTQNVEVRYWSQYFEGKPFGNKVLKKIRGVESYVLSKVDLVFVTSKEELKIFEEEYNIERQKLVLVPNGVDTDSVKPINDEEKYTIRKNRNWKYRKYIVFMGSNVKANIDAGNYIIHKLAPIMPETGFFIIGSVSNKLSNAQPNVNLLGVLSLEEKNICLSMCDVAINPIATGAGTNIKMLEYLSAGLPIVTTQIGARGLDLTNKKDAIITDLESFEKILAQLLEDDSVRRQIGHNARQKSQEFDWRKIYLNIENALKVTQNK